MARTEAGAALTHVHRQAQIALRADVLADLSRMWRLFARPGEDPMALFERFAAAAEIIIRQRHDDSAGLALAYFEEFRRREGVGGEAPRRVAPTPPGEVAREALAVAGRSGVAAALRSGRTAAEASNNGLVRVLGAAADLVLGGGRRTLTDLIRADRQASGWQRVTSGSPCPFCRMLAGRGAVYKTARSATFQAHTHCSCTPEPYYPGSRPLPANTRFAQEWTDALRLAREADELKRGTKNDALNAYRRYLAGRDVAGRSVGSPGTAG